MDQSQEITYWCNLSAKKNERIQKLEAEILALKGERVPVAWRHDDHVFRAGVVTLSEEVANKWRENGWGVTPLFACPQKPVISKEKLCDWLEDNFDITDSHRDAFAACFANHCNCIVESGGDQ